MCVYTFRLYTCLILEVNMYTNNKPTDMYSYINGHIALSQNIW